jgi:hypothetical protein
MKKVLLNFWVFICCFSGSILAQTQDWKALNYQAVALDEAGFPIKHRTVWLKFSLASRDSTLKPYYVENQKVLTNENGAFNIKLGRGNIEAGNWDEIPWATTSIWLGVEMSTNDRKSYELISNKQLLAVPFALHASTTNNLLTPNADSLEKSQSIYWTTSGNSNTKPPTQFLGTTDNQNLTFRSNNISHMTLTTQGKLELISKIPAGSDKNKSDYPMVVEGTLNTQGMWIKINGSRSNANNFMTFVDDAGIQGRIEGQTKSELLSSELYITQTALYALNAAVITAEVAIYIYESAAKLSSPYSTLAGIAIIAKGVNLTVKLASLLTAYNAWVDQLISKVGVTFSSSNGDYAEWLLRKPGIRDIKFGEVVGIKNGFVSLDTKSADHLMVVSKAPIVTGNMPQPEKEDLYEKVAFMGQVPVRVAGPVSVNDYIIPSGNNDGFAIAVHPEDMKTLDYGRIIGIAWEAAENHPINIVNVAVGINTNDLAGRVSELSNKVEQIEKYLTLKSDLNSSQTNLNSLGTANTNSTTISKLLTDSEFDQYIDSHAGQIKAIYQQMKKQFDNENVDYNSNPFLIDLLNHPVEVTKKLRRDPAYSTQWGLVDQKIKSLK